MRTLSQKHKRIARGFSLIELMVALTIFSIVMTVAVGTLLVLIDANAKAQALSSAMTNLSFAIDSMTRNIRTGRDYYCTSGTNLNNSLPGEVGGSGDTVRYQTQDCVAGNDAIVFTPGFETTTRMAYRLNNGSIEQWVDVQGESDGWVPITSDQPPAAVTVDELQIVVVGSDDNLDNDDEEQPRISLLISGSVENGLENPTEFQVQSNVTQRVLNY
jgi:prepilin-type N-terminal cleavage/methylation domain-containing protein